MKSYWEKIKIWVLGHKVLAAITALNIILVGGLLLSVLSLGSARESSPTFIGEPASPGRSGGFESFDAGAPDSRVAESIIYPPDIDAGGAEVEVKQASFTIESKDAEDEAEQVRELSAGRGGYIEQSRKSETSTRLTITMTARIPQEDFEEFVEGLNRDFEIESHNISNFRIPIQRQLDELDIIRRTLEELSTARAQVALMPIGQQRIELLMQITERELQLRQRERMYERDLAGRQRQGDMATVTVTLYQKLKADLLPKDTGNMFRDGFRQSFENIMESLVGIVTYSIALFFAVVKWMVYAVIIIVPVWFALNYGKGVYKKYGKK